MGRDRKGKGKASMKDTKQKVTGIKEVDDLEVRIKNLEDFFSNLRNRKLKQKDTLLDASSDEMYMEEKEVVFKIHTKGYFEYDPLRKYYYKNLEWEEDDAVLRCCSSAHFDTRFKRKINKSKKTGVIHDEGAGRKREKSLVNGGNKGKEKLFEDEGADKKRKKTLVTGGSKGKEKVFEDECICSNGNEDVVIIYKRYMVNGKAKRVEVVGAVKTRRDRGVVIEGKEEVVSKRGVGSKKIHGTSVKVKSE
nr:hypothetical protein [Tanacetum cinerariifolium]